MMQDTNEALESRESGAPSWVNERIPRRTFIGRSAGLALAVGGVGGFLSACGGDSSDEVVVMAWSVYLTREVQERFTEVTGLTMKAVPADDDQSMFTKLRAGGGSQYDVVFANAGWAPTYQDQDLVEVIDLAEIEASGDLWPVFKENTDFPYVVESDKVLLYPNMWSASSMIWNTTVPFQPSRPYSWNSLWDAPSGKVILHGAHEDFIAMSGLALGVSPQEIYSMNGAQLEEAANYLSELAPFQISPNSDAVTARAIASGKADIGFASSLGIAEKANNIGGGDVARTVIPEEGSLGWVDGPQLVKDAKNRDNALEFMNFFGSDPQTQTYLWDTYYFAQCSKPSTERALKAGGDSKQIAISIGADNPDLASKLTFLAPPDDAEAWTQAYDQAVG